MKKNIARVLIVALLLMTSVAGPMPAYAVYNGFAAELGPFIQSVVHSGPSRTVNVQFTTDLPGTLYFVVTAPEYPSLTATEIVNATVGSGIICKDSMADISTGLNAVPLSLTGLAAGGHYKIQLALDSGSSLYKAAAMPTFYNATVTQFGLVESLMDGYVIEATADAPGTFIGKVYAAAAVVTAENVFAGTGPTVVTNASMPAGAGTPITMALMGGVNPYTDYDVYCLFKDADNVKHYDIHKLDNEKTQGNKILSVYYDNGTLASNTDDKIVLDMQYPVAGSTADSSKFTVTFNDDSLADITLTVSDFAFSYAGKKIFLTLNMSAGIGLDRFNDDAEFHQGILTVAMASDTNITPAMDTSGPFLEASSPLDHATIVLPNLPRLVSINYSKNSTPTEYDDDFISIGYDSAITGIADTAETYNLGFVVGTVLSGSLTPLNPVTHYTLAGDIDATTVKLELTPAGATLLATAGKVILAADLDLAYIPVSGSVLLDPSSPQVSTLVANSDANLAMILFHGRPILGFSPQTKTYNNVPILYSDYLTYGNNHANFVTAIPAMPYSSITISHQTGPDREAILVTAPDGTTTETYTLNTEVNYCSLNKITIGGIDVPSFDKYASSFTAMLPAGTSVLPTVEVLPEQPLSMYVTVTYSHSGTLPGPVTYTITVSDSMNAQSKSYTLLLASHNQLPPGETEVPPPGFNPNVPPPTYFDPTNPTAPPPDITPEQIEQFTNALNQLGSGTNTPGDIPPELLATQLGSLNTLLSGSDTYTDTQLFRTLIRLDNTLDVVNQAMDTPDQDNTQIIQQIETMTESVEAKIAQLDNPVDALTVTQQFVVSLTLFKEKTDEQMTEIDKSVENMLNNINERLGTVKIEGPKDGDQPVEIQIETVQKAIDRQLQFADDIQALKDKFFGDSDVRKTVTSIVLELERPTGVDNIQTLLKPEIVDQIKNNKLDEVSMDVGGAKITIPTSEVKSASEFIIKMEFKKPPAPPATTTGSNSNAAEQRPTQIIEFTITENGQEKDTYQQPIELKFELKDFGITPQEGNFAGIYKLNEASGTWFVVGGRVDFQLGVIFVKRNSLSQYTVMKSKKSFSDSDTSWAKNEIDSLLNKGIVEESGNFQPKALLTRAEFASWIAKAYGLSPTSNKPVPFNDVQKADKNYEAIAAVYQMGIISGKSAKKFDPNGNITADEMAVIIGKTLVMFDNKQASTKVKSKHLASVKEKSSASWAESDQALLMELGIASGEAFAKGNGFVTKETAAATFAKFYNS